MSVVVPQQARRPRVLAALGSAVLILSATSAAFAAKPASAGPNWRQASVCPASTKSRACSRGLLTTSRGTARLSTVHMPKRPGADASPYQGWLSRSRVPTPPGEVTYFNERCPFAYPNADPRKEAQASGCVVGTTIYLEQAGEDLRSDRVFSRFEFMHEVGHVYENGLFAEHPGYRQRVRTILGDRRVSCAWNGDPDGSGRREVCDTPPNEYFADAYAFCSLYGLDRKIPEGDRGVYGYEPGNRSPSGDEPSITQGAHRRMCRFIVRIGERAGIDVSGFTRFATPGSRSR
jgi:hypothetical protein